MCAYTSSAHVIRTRHPLPLSARGVHMCAYTSSAHVIRTRHLLPSTARGVHMCTRPSSVKYVEYRISFVSSVVLYHCFYGKWLKCVKYRCYVCKTCFSMCLHNKSIHDLWNMLQWDFGVILFHSFVSLSLRWICKGVAFTFKSAIYVKYLLILFFQ